MVALAAVGAAYQASGDARDRRSNPAPGRFVEVDGRRMHLYCTGEGAPTVVLEAGATGFAQTWAWIQSDLATDTRVCSYDRAGLGWSEASDTGHDGVTIGRRLHGLLARSGEPGPYVLVGHSLGGSLVQAFTGQYPDDVLALGLVDPSHPDQLERFPPEIEEQQQGFYRMIAIASTLSHFGVLRATNVLGRNAKGLPEPDYRTARMFAASPRHLRASHAEMLAWDETMDAARRVVTFEERPVVVVSATKMMDGMPDGFLDLNREMHSELAAMSTRGRHVEVEGSDHYSLLMDRDHASETAGILRDLVLRARSIADAEDAESS